MTVSYQLPSGITNVKASDVAGVVLRGEHFAQDIGGKLHVYRGGVYVPGGNQTVGELVKKILKISCVEQSWTRHLADETAAYILADAPLLMERPPMDIVNLDNGLLHLSPTPTLQPHSPKFLSSIQLPVIYDPHAPEPKAWKKFIVDVFPADCVEAGVIWYILAWLMLPNTALQKALLFMSEDGGTGKSTLIKVIAAFLGLGNVAHESLQDIEENKFRAANLLGKLFNCFADLRGGEMKSSTFFKVTSGEDVVSVERKFGHSFDLISFARQCYSTNNFPVVKDAGHAFFRRWWVCKFTNRFDGTTAQRRQEEILAELSTPQELSGVLNEALKVLPCVLDPTTGIPEPPSCIAARLEFEAMTSPVSVWLAKWVTVGSDKRVEKQTLREAYNRDAASNGRPILSNMAFTGYLWRTYKNKLGEYREPYGLRRRLWTGVGLLEVANVEETEVEVVA